MTSSESIATLSGQLLVAMPGMGDPRFAQSVIFLCAHSDGGAMGLIVNKRLPELMLDELLEQLDIGTGAGSAGRGVYFGGPVEAGRGFVLHSADWQAEASTLKVDDSVSMTATKDILEAIARGTGPGSSLTALGYAGWGPGQLETELQRNDWLTVPADAAILFDAETDTKWSRAVRKLGIDPSMLSSGGGRA